MANQSSSRLKGDDYQHLISWHHILSLLRKKGGVEKVCIEDPDAGHVDDITVFYKSKGRASDFYQIKYHVDHREQYSLDSFLDTKSGSSLLQKFWRTWNTLRKTNPAASANLHLVSNWHSDPDDPMLKLVSGENHQLSEGFYTAVPGSDIGKARERIKVHLNATDEDLNAFFRSLHLDFGSDCSLQYKRLVEERMESLGLKNDENALDIAVSLVRGWIKQQHFDVDLDILQKTLQNRDLYVPANQPAAATVYLTTVKEHKFDVPPDYVLDWREYFEPQANVRGHRLKDQYDWNTTLLPELHAIEARLNAETGAHIIRARGLARLSAWFAFGFTFSSVSGYTIEISQQDRLWRTDEQANSSLSVVSDNGEGEIYDGTYANRTVAVGISVSGDLSAEVRRHISELGGIDALLLLRSAGELGKDALKSGGDVITLAAQVKQKVRTFVKIGNTERLLLFYFGPLSGACFIGHQLNAVCKEIQIMENIPNGYIPSFLLI